MRWSSVPVSFCGINVKKKKKSCNQLRMEVKCGWRGEKAGFFFFFFFQNWLTQEFHGWNGDWKVQKHNSGSFFSLLSGQDKFTQCIKEFSATTLYRWWGECCSGRHRESTLKWFYANLRTCITSQLFAKKMEEIPLCLFFLFLFILIYMCVELLCSCASNNNNVSSWSSQVGVSVYYIWTRFVQIFYLFFVFSNKEPIDVPAASSSELNTRVKGRKCGSRSENVTSSTIIYMGQVFVFLLFVVPLPYNNKRRCQEEMNSSHLTASHPVMRAYFDAKWIKKSSRAVRRVGKTLSLGGSTANHKQRPSTIFSFWMRVFNYLFLHSFVCLFVRYSWDIIFSFCVHAAPHPLTTNQPCAAQIIWLPESPSPSAIRLTGGVALIIAVWWRV